MRHADGVMGTHFRSKDWSTFVMEQSFACQYNGICTELWATMRNTCILFAVSLSVSGSYRFAQIWRIVSAIFLLLSYMIAVLFNVEISV